MNLFFYISSNNAYERKENLAIKNVIKKEKRKTKKLSYEYDDESDEKMRGIWH